ncbi:hypothetical protein [Saccharothrix luteola]|uniref:hypothetical protein n=1 Tax=Saccharothrix luteola TaxID=2893018 RepID=UPI001E310F44|nr:hypothetical protein [Saccharothrix luteola]MCC8242914.1 hypothetical protein [Saccharothrix luteola]
MISGTEPSPPPRPRRAGAPPRSFESPRPGDHATPYLRRVLAEVFGLDLHVAEAELTHAFWSPEMASLRGLAEESSKTGQERAAEHGLRVARLISA